jgi:hypothetical protein
MQVISSFHHAEFSPYCNTLYTVFLSKQPRRGRNIIFPLFLFVYKWSVLNIYHASNEWVDLCKSNYLVLQLQPAAVSQNDD